MTKIQKIEIKLPVLKCVRCRVDGTLKQMQFLKFVLIVILRIGVHHVGINEVREAKKK